MSGMKHWIAQATARDVRIFPVPGADILRMHQNELDSDFIAAPNPREANVLLVMGDLNDQLARKAAVAYLQIPRPRVLVVAGPQKPPHLPKPDVHISLDDNFLDDALPKVQELLRNHAWSENAEPWEPEFLTNLVEDSDNGGEHDHHHHHDHGNGDGENGNEHDHEHEDHAGHDHSGHEHEKTDDEHKHQHSDHEHKEHDHETHQHGSPAEDDAHKRHDHCHDPEGGKGKNSHHDDSDEHDHKHTPDKGGNHSGHSHDHNHAHEGHDHSGHSHDHGHGGHDHGDMDFMSMVAMTKDLPRPKDGLPMNRSEVHFGPFHPGLPGGLSVFMELDGDTVIKASVEGNVATRSIEDMLPLEAEQLPDALARLNPLTPPTYRLLAHKALVNALGDDGSISPEELGILERERIASHLNWLATFAKTVGNEWMHRQAARWHVLHRSGEVLPEKLHAFMNQIRSMPYLQTKLSVGGIIPETLLHHLSGPVAKAAGKIDDARSDDEYYQTLSCDSVTTEKNSAWGRLLVRLQEIEQSLDLINTANKMESERTDINLSDSGEGSAQLESSRGTISLAISVNDGMVEQLQLETPSQPLAGLVPTLTEEAELSDALVQIASLDIAPWEIEFEGMEVNQ